MVLFFFIVFIFLAPKFRNHQLLMCSIVLKPMSIDNTAQIDLKCKEKVTDSDTESQSDVESSTENRVFLQQQYSPLKNNVIDSSRNKSLKMNG